MDELNKIQSDILNKGLKRNPLLRPHAIPVLNNQLNTVQKDSVIKSINEIHMKLTTMDRSLETFMDELVEIIGNWKNDPRLQENLDLMAGNLIESIIYLHRVIGVDGLKRTVIFYFQNFFGEERSVGMYVPYRGELRKVNISIPEPSEYTLYGELMIGGSAVEVVLPKGERLVSLEIEGEIDHETCVFKINTLDEEEIGVSLDDVEVYGVNVSVEFVQSS